MSIDDSYTKALLHFNGADGSTTFADESGKTWTAAGNAQIDTAQSVFGGASGLFDGTLDGIRTPDHADFDVGSGDFTIDFRVRLAVADRYLCGQADSSLTAASRCWMIQTLSTNVVRAQVSTGTTSYNIDTVATLSINTWYHLALVRNGNVFKIYIDGIERASSTLAITLNNSASQIGIGCWGEYTSYTHNGWVDEFRFSKGIARWTANFTPPTSEYRPPSKTVWFF